MSARWPLRCVAAVGAAVGACALAAEAPPASGGSEPPSFELVAARVAGGVSESISAAPYEATVTVAQPEAQTVTAAGGVYSATGGILFELPPRPDELSADGFESP